MHYYIMKILNKQERQEIAFNHSPDIDFSLQKNYWKSMFFTYLYYSCIKNLLVRI